MSAFQKAKFFFSANPVAALSIVVVPAGMYVGYRLRDTREETDEKLAPREFTPEELEQNEMLRREDLKTRRNQLLRDREAITKKFAQMDMEEKESQ
ncbi:hypothetical protein K7432_004011 [Basidiobolus ranarum]|uniref:Uncharacterized protein n=1 Tax=Basidiobolus ranarum TaxID=34480 RepID=A0ABR2W5A3_9FUNG